MDNTINQYGIEGRQAPELNIPQWIDGNGNETEPIYLRDFKGKYIVLFGFQAWCKGCHTHGFPALQKMEEALKDNDKVQFLAIQTVFEGAEANTFKRMKEIQQEYNLKIPFGHDIGDASTGNISSTMHNYRTGGTPWIVLIDRKGRVVFNDFHLNVENAIGFLKKLR